MLALSSSSDPFLFPFPISRFSSSDSSDSSGPSTSAYYCLHSPPRPQSALSFSPSPPRPLAPYPSFPPFSSPSPLRQTLAHILPGLFPTPTPNAYLSRVQSISPVQRGYPCTPANAGSSVASPHTPERPRESLLAQFLRARLDSPSPETSPFSSPLTACPSDVSPVTSSPPVPLCRLQKATPRKRRREPSPSPIPRAKRTRPTRLSTRNNTSAELPPSSSLPSSDDFQEDGFVHASDEDEDVDASGDDDPAFAPPTRAFPAAIPLHPEFPRFYRRFTVPVSRPRGSGNPNEPRSPLDLYTPRLTRGCGRTKVGLCPICPRSPSSWYSMKFSAFNYHMQYFHGISPTTARPFSPPTAFRVVPRPQATKHERRSMIEGRCHRCKAWIPIEGVKDVDAKVKELYWWKHAAACHGTSTIPGECGVYIEDAAYARAVENAAAA